MHPGLSRLDHPRVDGQYSSAHKWGYLLVLPHPGQDEEVRGRRSGVMNEYGFLTTVLSDGSIEIPSAIRTLLGLKDGPYLVRTEGEEIMFSPLVVDRPTDEERPVAPERTG